MRIELPYFKIGKAYGGSQDWMIDPWMHLGGCAALTACDSCIYFALQQPKQKYYPYNLSELSKKDYIRFSQVMKPYLRPRAGGVDKLSLYIEGFGAYLEDIGETSLHMEGFSGEETACAAGQKVKEQIDRGMLIPCLVLQHKDVRLRDYVWHWFVLNGYEETEDMLLVKAVTYGAYRWIDFAGLWDTGHDEKGGLILYHM